MKRHRRKRARVKIDNDDGNHTIIIILIAAVVLSGIGYLYWQWCRRGFNLEGYVIEDQTQYARSDYTGFVGKRRKDRNETDPFEATLVYENHQPDSNYDLNSHMSSSKNLTQQKPEEIQ